MAVNAAGAGSDGGDATVRSIAQRRCWQHRRKKVASGQGNDRLAVGHSSMLMVSVGSTGTADAAVAHALCPDFEDNTFGNDANRLAVCVAGMRHEEATWWRISGKKTTAGVSGRHG